MVARVAPFHLTDVLVTNFVPFNVKVNAPVPARPLDGDNEVSVGTGLFTVKVRDPEVPPLAAVGLTTVTMLLRLSAISATVMDACNCPPFT